jgi:pilus assembly protein CpaF
VKENQNSPNTHQDWRTEAGPIKPYLHDAEISEIMINRWDKVFIEKKGIIEESEYKFQSPEGLVRFAQAIAVTMGRELNRKNPYLDTTLPDGSRVNVVVPPLTLDGPSITIRKSTSKMQTANEMVASGQLDAKVAYFLNQAVLAKRNVVISGGTGSGKTTLLNILSSFIRTKERVVSLEDTPELQIRVKNIVRMVTKPGNANDPAVTMEALLKNALRMRPDRILIGECRGAEAWDMLMAMNTGHEGSMTTVHANTANDALRRLESMILRSGTEAPLSMIKSDIGNTIHIIVQTNRGLDGKRRVEEIIEVCGMKNQDYETNTIFKFVGNEISSTGHIPKFVSDKNITGLKFTPDFFYPEKKIKIAS